MQYQPLVSIITPCYNAEKFIEETILSVIIQSYMNWEMIIVDDCSKDKSKEIINKYIKQDQRIKLIELKENSGPSVARNVAIEFAKGTYLAFLDSDDVWLPHKLEVQINYMESNGYSFTYTPSIQINEESDIIDCNRIVPLKMDYNSYLKNTVIGCLSVVINRTMIKKVHFPEISMAEDMAAWLDILRTGIIAYGLNNELSKYRVLKQSRSANKFLAAKKVWYIYRQYERLSLLKSLYCFMFYSINALSRNWRLI